MLTPTTSTLIDSLDAISTVDDTSSDSSASSVATMDTIRPLSRDHLHPAPDTHWSKYYDQELYLENETETQHAKYHAYLTPPTDPKKGPLFICHHGAGASGLSFAIIAQELRHQLPAAGVLSLEARGHGSLITNPTTGEEIVDFSLEALVSDALTSITLTTRQQKWPQLPPAILLGHSLGGAVLTTIANNHSQFLGTSLIGCAVLDVVEGSAIEALSHMRNYLSMRPRSFASIDEAISWHTRSRTIRNVQSAQASVPSLLIPSRNPGVAGEEYDGDDATKPPRLVWKTNLSSTSPWWEEWFRGMSQKFLSGRGAKLLILAGTDRLDRELTIAQMQGKFQLVVLPNAGHFVHEDMPETTADVLVEFCKRNDRSTLVLPPKVSDLIAQGKKV